MSSYLSREVSILKGGKFKKCFLSSNGRSNGSSIVLRRGETGWGWNERIKRGRCSFRRPANSNFAREPRERNWPDEQGRSNVGDNRYPPSAARISLPLITMSERVAWDQAPIIYTSVSGAIGQKPWARRSVCDAVARYILCAILAARSPSVVRAVFVQNCCFCSDENASGWR